MFLLWCDGHTCCCHCEAWSSHHKSYPLINLITHITKLPVIFMKGTGCVSRIHFPPLPNRHVYSLCHCN